MMGWFPCCESVTVLVVRGIKSCEQNQKMSRRALYLMPPAATCVVERVFNLMSLVKAPGCIKFTVSFCVSDSDMPHHMRVFELFWPIETVDPHSPDNLQS
jgi:hypothetical protein